MAELCVAAHAQSGHPQDNAVALGAAAATSLARLGITPRRGRILVTEPEHMPRLCPLLMAKSMGMVTSWTRSDAQSYPLRLLMRHNDILIDLAGAAADATAPGRVLTTPSAPFECGALVLPGLLAGLCPRGITVLTPELLAACASALELLTPGDGLLPPPDEPNLIGTVATAVADASPPLR